MEVVQAAYSDHFLWLQEVISIGWFKGKITGNSHISLDNLWVPVDFPLGQPIDYFRPSLDSPRKTVSLRVRVEAAGIGAILKVRAMDAPLLHDVVVFLAAGTIEHGET